MAIKAKQIEDLSSLGLIQNPSTKAIDINTDDVTLEVSANFLQLKSGGITDGYINASAAISLSKLASTVIQADGGAVFTGNQSMGGFNLTGINIASFGSTPATDGSLRLPNNFSMFGRKNDDSGDIFIMGLNASDRIVFGSTTASIAPANLIINTSTFTVKTSAVDFCKFTSSSVTTYKYITYNSAAYPMVFQETSTTNSDTGDDMWYIGQDCTGTTSTGGIIVFNPGTGISDEGKTRLYDADENLKATFSDGYGFKTDAAIYRNVTLIDNTDSPYTVAANDYIIECDVSTNVITIYLTNTSFRELIIKDISSNASTNNITVDADTVPSKTIEGLTTYTMNADDKGIRIFADTNSNYHIIGEYP